MTRPTPLDEEIVLDPARYIVSKTDTKGIITYANDYFVEVCGYSEKELLGSPHNIVRHPDMPRIAFKLMWDTIQQGKDFKAIVKNLAKDGRYYWVITRFECSRHPRTGEIIGYTAYRRAPSRRGIERIEPIYKRLCEYEQVGGMEMSGKFLVEFLQENKTTYDKFIDELAESNMLTELILKIQRKLFGNK